MVKGILVNTDFKEAILKALKKLDRNNEGYKLIAIGQESEDLRRQKWKLYVSADWLDRSDFLDSMRNCIIELRKELGESYFVIDNIFLIKTDDPFIEAVIESYKQEKTDRFLNVVFVYQHNSYDFEDFRILQANPSQ